MTQRKTIYYMPVLMLVSSFLLMSIPVLTHASHARIWTDHNDHDPGITLLPPPPAQTGGTEDINIGVGELWQDGRETDLATLRERARSMHDGLQFRNSSNDK